MSLALLTLKNNYRKNGIWFFTRLLNKAVGEERYDALRVYRRIWQARIYYTRQQFLYEIFVESPEISNLIGAFPKADNSHGFPMYSTYEMYRDFQENTPNSDGWFGMWFVVIATFYLIEFYYSYMLPTYWCVHPMKNEQTTRLRMRDSLGTMQLEEIYGLQWAEFAWGPHDLHYNRLRGAMGYKNPDDLRSMHLATFNRKHKYREHYITEAHSNSQMTMPY